ncbi:MAG: putative 2OG-Fe(II) oxygenase [Sulfuricaulis sp.]
MPETSIARRGHYLGGRYENIYVEKKSLPEIGAILDVATERAAEILGHPLAMLRIGWWLNVMQPGDVTHAHTHDDTDELLSGVYYIDAPRDSGRLVLFDAGRREEIEPIAGRFVFFAPDLLHEVTRNVSDRARLSMGFNIGRLR